MHSNCAQPDFIVFDTSLPGSSTTLAAIGLSMKSARLRTNTLITFSA